MNRPIRKRRTLGETLASPTTHMLATPDGKRWPNQLSEDVEASIIDAAYQVFRDRGVGAATTGDIASAAGISKATLYRRFENKWALFESVVFSSLKLVVGAFDDIALDPNHPEQSLRQYAMKIREIQDLERYREVLRMVLAEAPRHQRIALIWRETFIAEMLGKLLDYFGLLAKNGQATFPSPELAARNFYVLFAGSFKGLFGVVESAEEREKIFEADLHAFMKGNGINS